MSKASKKTSSNKTSEIHSENLFPVPGIGENHEAEKEELQSSNEELLSDREALQRLNEELKTSKEELQNIKEELITIKQELYDGNEQYNLVQLYAESIFAARHEPLLILDHEFKIKSANNAFYKTFKITEDETIGKILYELQNNGWRIPGIHKLLLKIQKENEKSLGWEVTHTFPAIGERIICLNAVPVQKEKGEHCILLALEDITEKKLLENQSLLSTIVDNSNDAILSQKLDGTLMSWNRSAENIFGFNKEEIVGKNISLVIPPELHHEEELIMHKIKKGEVFPHFNTMRRTKEGKRMNVSLTVSPIKDAEGKVTGASKILRDVTEKVIACKKIAASEAKNIELLNRFKILVEQAPVAIVILNSVNYTVEIANKSYLQLVGKEKGFVGKPIFESLTELKDQGIKELLDGVIKTGVPYYGNELELKMHRNKKSEQVFFNFVYHPIRDIDDKITGIMVVATDVTEQVVSRKKVEESEKRYNMMVMQSPFGFALLKGENMVVKLANDSIKEMWGKGKKVEGQPLIEILPEMKSQQVPELLHMVYTTGKSYFAYESLIRFERRGKMEDFYFNFIFQPSLEIDGTISGVTIIAVEVTPQAILNRKIKESESRYNALIQSSPFAICLLHGKDLIITAVNKATIDLWGKGSDVIGKPCFDLLPELADQGYREIFNEVYATGKPFKAIEIPIEFIRGGKNDFQYYNFVFFAQRNINNEIDGIGVIASNVTEVAEYHEKLKDSEEQFRQTADLLPDKVFKANADGNFFYLNKAWEETTGTSVEILKNDGWLQTVHPNERDELKNYWIISVKTGRDCEMQFRMKDKTGNYRWHLCRAMALEDDGKIKMWIGAATDIQEQKRREEEKSEFISIASHELKTPLTAAKLYINLLQETLSGKESPYNNLMFAQKAGKSVEKLELLINELLDVNKIQQGKLDLKITTFDFNEMLDETIEEIHLTSRDYKIFKTGDVGLSFKGDKDRLQQVVTNLLSNAMKYSPESDKVFVRVTEEKGMIKVVIKDQGVGIKKENLKKIFDLYYREEESSLPFQGFGIGLSISSEIVQRHNGEIWAESEPGKGSTFYFTLPM